MSTQPTIEITDFIDRQPVSGFQIMIAVLCFFIVAFDGFDAASVGFIAPAIRAEWHLTPAHLAPLFASGLAGLTAGALIFGPLADRFGRKKVLVTCVFFFSATSLLSAFSPSLDGLIALRFLTGLGLGGAMPNAITLTSEYCPSRKRSFIVTTMFCGFTIGSSLGGLASAGLIEAYGWRSVLMIGGLMPLLLCPVLLWKLPESARYLLVKGKQLKDVTRTLGRIAPKETNLAAHVYVADVPVHGSPVASLFHKDLARGTVLLWIMFFMGLLVIYLLSSWLPTLLRETGASLATAALVTAMLQLGGTVGAIVLGWVMDRVNPYYVLATTYTLAGVFVAAIGHLTAEPWSAAAAVFAAGFCVSGAQVGAYALSASYYPTQCRATGVSWANGIGRMGSVVGSLGGGAMLAMHLTMPALFLLVAIPAVISGAAMLAFGRHRRAALSQALPALTPDVSR